ncbi:MAG: serine/threonine protein kinase [Actinobacteria bacterium]|nr:serine/threonine protein kinase [Actinomycetota bacterium]
MSDRVPDIPGLLNVTLLGVGGFASVYKAFQPDLDRWVAVKVLNGSIDSRRHQRRFERECEALGRLGFHKFVVDVFSTGILADGRPYVVMKLYERGSLGSYVRRYGPLAPDRAVALTVDLASALAVAHSMGVLHRDIKPDNVLMVEDGSVVLADFGIANIVDARQEVTVTQVASEAYAAPETLDGKPNTPSSEVYSLAATAYMMLTGHPPFAGMSPMARAVAIATEPPSPITSPGVGRSLSRAVLSGLEKEPEKRPESVEVFAARLQVALHDTNEIASLSRGSGRVGGGPPAAVGPPTRNRKVLLGAFAAVTSLVVASLGAFLLSGRGEDQADVRASADVAMAVPAQGDCWNYGPELVASQEAVGVKHTAARQDCATRHSAETVAVWEAAESAVDQELPSERSQCTKQLMAWLGTAAAGWERFAASRFQAVVLPVPSADDADLVRCDAVLVDKARGRVEYQQVEGSWRDALRDGVPRATRKCGLAPEQPRLWMRCEAPGVTHEVVRAAAVGSGGPHPGEMELIRRTRVVCRGENVKTVWVPTVEQWEAGSQLALCGHRVGDL